jgi:hypothetical protein
MLSSTNSLEYCLLIRQVDIFPNSDACFMLGHANHHYVSESNAHSVFQDSYLCLNICLVSSPLFPICTLDAANDTLEVQKLLLNRMRANLNMKKKHCCLTAANLRGCLQSHAVIYAARRLLD